MIEVLFNEDGTEFCPPKNPLQEKWNKLYPPIPKPEHSQVCDGYSCMWCGRCPRGEYWKVPEEDREIWEQYQREWAAYLEAHNPNWRSTFKESVREGLKIAEKVRKNLKETATT